MDGQSPNILILIKCTLYLLFIILINVMYLYFTKQQIIFSAIITLP